MECCKKIIHTIHRSRALEIHNSKLENIITSLQLSHDTLGKTPATYTASHQTGNHTHTIIQAMTYRGKCAVKTLKVGKKYFLPVRNN